MTTPHLRAMLMADEGLRLTAYQDGGGVWTIGYGHTGPDVKPGMTITQAEAEAYLDEDLIEAVLECDRHTPWWRMLDDVRQDVMISLMFNMGWGDGHHRLSSFANTLALIHMGRYAEAADHLMASLWAKQVGGRARRLTTMLRTGISQTVH